jgi:hypothetical protein
MASTKSVLKWESNRAGGLLLRGPPQRGAGVPAEAAQNAGKSLGEHIDALRFERLAGVAKEDHWA